MNTRDDVTYFFKDHPLIRQQGLLPSEVKDLINWVYFIEHRNKATVEDLLIVLQGTLADHIDTKTVLRHANDLLWEISQVDDTRSIHSSHLIELEIDDGVILLKRRLLTWGEIVNKDVFYRFFDY